MKKNLVCVVAASLMLMSGVAMAGQSNSGGHDGGPGGHPIIVPANQTVTGDYSGQAVSTDYDSAATIFGDTASAGAGGNVYGSSETYANGSSAYEDGTIKGIDFSKAGTLAVDFGNTSIAGGYAVNAGAVVATGLAIGRDGAKETVDTYTSIYSNATQANFAKEGSNGGTWVTGGNSSSAVLNASASDDACGNGFASETTGLAGYSFTAGGTAVTVDNFGRTQNIEAYTGNMATTGVCGADTVDSVVTGAGAVAGVAVVGNSWAGGESTFSYTGANTGAGNATLDATVTNHGNYSVVNVTGSSTATAGAANSSPH